MNIRRASGLLVWTVVLWVALWHDISVANVASGVVVGVLVLFVSGLPRTTATGDRDRARFAPLAMARLVGYVVYKLVEANLYLAWEIVTPRNRINVGNVAVPLRTDSSLAAMVVANVITLTPGSMTIESSGTPPVLYVNVMHLHDLEQGRRDLLHVERLCVQAFGSLEARRQLDSDGVGQEVSP